MSSRRLSWLTATSVIFSVVLPSLINLAFAETGGLAQLLGKINVDCDSIRLVQFSYVSEETQALNLEKATCEAVLVRNGNPDVGAILIAALLPSDERKLAEIGTSERRQQLEVDLHRLKTQLKPVLNICLELLDVAPEKRNAGDQRGCLFGLPVHTSQGQALSLRLSEKPESYVVCASEPLVAPMRADHPLRGLEDPTPLTWNRLESILARDGFVCGEGNDISCIRLVPMILTGLPSEDPGNNSNDAIALFLRMIRLYHGKWQLDHWNKEACSLDREQNWCDKDNPPYGDSSGICIEPEDFHAMGALLLAP